MTTTDFHHVCPFCLTEQDAATDFDTDLNRPEPGTIGLCWDCGNVGVYVDVDGRLELHKPDAELQAELDASEQIRDAKAHWRAYRQQQRRGTN